MRHWLHLDRENRHPGLRLRIKFSHTRGPPLSRATSLHIPPRIMGVDIKRGSYSEKHRPLRAPEGGEHLTFACQPHPGGRRQTDIVLAAHACDTATDDAIAHRNICQCRQGRFERAVLPSSPQRCAAARGCRLRCRPLMRHGILHERTADIVTDAFRRAGLADHGLSARRSWSLHQPGTHRPQPHDSCRRRRAGGRCIVRVRVRGNARFLAGDPLSRKRVPGVNALLASFGKVLPRPAARPDRPHLCRNWHAFRDEP